MLLCYTYPLKQASAQYHTCTFQVLILVNTTSFPPILAETMHLHLILIGVPEGWSASRIGLRGLG